MRYISSILLSVILLCVNVPQLRSQEFVATPVEISTEKVRIRGELFYVHKVLKGQTLYSISKKYNVTVEQINEINPTLAQGLKSGMIIYIPIKEGNPVQASENEQLRGEDLTSSQAGANTSSGTIKQDGQETPGSKTTPQNNDSQRFVRHKVKWFESLKDVAKKYDVPLEALYALNNIVPPSKTRIKTVLIPDEQYINEYYQRGEADETLKEEATDPENIFAQEELKADATIVPPAQIKDSVYDYNIGRARFDKPIKITVILPFNVSENIDNLPTYIADFYCGIILGADHLREKGQFDDYLIETVDLSQYTSTWELISSGKLDNSELVIGPISTRDMHPISTFCLNNRIPVVSPLDNKTSKLLEGNPYMYLFPSDSEDALERQIEKMVEKNNEAVAEKIVVLHEKGYEESYLVTSTRNGLDTRGAIYNTFSYNFMEGREINSAMMEALDSVNLNKVIIPSHSEAFISDALRNLHLIQSTRNYKIEVYGMSKWRGMETLDTDYFHQLNLHLAVPYNIDYNNENSIKFINDYLEAFNAEPTPFAFQGYDIITFFVEAMNTYGKKFPARIINLDRKLIQSNVLFKPVKYGSGAENKALKDVVYQKGWTISEE